MSAVKKKRVSKKNKTAWRKFTDVKDVDEFLEDQRLEERLGFQVSKLSNNDLFHFDVIPDNKSELLTPKQQKRLRIRNSEPKCYSSLQPSTKVPDPIAKRNRVKSKEERKNLLVKKKEEEERANGIIRAKELQAFNDRQHDSRKRANKPKKLEIKADLWGDSGNISDIVSELWVEDTVKRHVLRNSGMFNKRISRPKYKEQTVLPSIDIPHPGTSYNPSYEDHQNLLQEVASIERKIMKEEAHLDRVTKLMRKKFSAGVKTESWLTEMSQGLPTTESNLESECEEDGDYKAVNPPVKNKKKTLQQRRKHKEHLEHLKALEKKKLEKKKIADIYKLRFLQKQIEQVEEKTKLLQQKREKVKEYKLKEAKRLGSVKFEEPDLVFAMHDELTGNLRNLKKKCNLLEDRFKRLQKRNVLEPRVRQKRPKVKTKKFVRSGHKDDWKLTVAKSTTL